MNDVSIPAGGEDTPTFYDAVGGEETFRRLVHHFYTGVREDPVLLPLYPPEELDEAEERLRMFLVQYWGGPRTYSFERGHPRLRMRHAHFPIDRAASERWLAHMRASLDEQALPEELDTLLRDYFDAAAPAMINTDG